MNLWHDVPIGKKIPDEFNCIIEVPSGSFNKYEIDKETGLIGLDRVNYDAAPYPFDYGFVPQTLWDDGDALDVMLLTTYPLDVGILAKARPVALMEMTDCGESDDKIIAVPADDKRFDHVQDLADLSPHMLKQFKLFWETRKMLKGENPSDYVITINAYKGKDAARDAIKKSIEMYKSKFAK